MTLPAALNLGLKKYHADAKVGAVFVSIFRTGDETFRPMVRLNSALKKKCCSAVWCRIESNPDSPESLAHGVVQHSE